MTFPTGVDGRPVWGLVILYLLADGVVSLRNVFSKRFFFLHYLLQLDGDFFYDVFFGGVGTSKTIWWHALIGNRNIFKNVSPYEICKNVSCGRVGNC